jgi:hypothetical protein
MLCVGAVVAALVESADGVGCRATNAVAWIDGMGDGVAGALSHAVSMSARMKTMAGGVAQRNLFMMLL